MNGKLMSHIKEAVGKYCTAKEWLGSCGFDEGTVVKLLGEFGVKLVMHVCSKQSKTRTQFKSIDQVCPDFVQCALAAIKKPTVKPPWQTDAHVDKTSSAFREFPGTAFDHSSSASMGFVPQALVVSNSGKKDTYMI
eukprot:6616625-Pyramimonas_sp.AAC.1